MRRVGISALLTALLVILPTGSAFGVIINLSASMDCAQAGTCGAGGTGTGTAVITLDTGSNLLSWNVSWSGMSGADFLAHFHGPALPGQNAGVQVGIGVPSPQIGNAVISASQAADLLAGLWYVNIHSTTFNGGEIRGQVVPEPATALLVVAGLIGLSVSVRRRKE